eukprot:TRINITY_DN4331_c0_g1_i1.p1 TRINITY_DN4331_c0_g1~~TRINITY_DN4331_c0_g1_i1.p1  ORF type:complete len:349 (-),score=82.36 TRINITY_DN4331_c0_g1_i1:15-929(-)
MGGSTSKTELPYSRMDIQEEGAALRRKVEEEKTFVDKFIGTSLEKGGKWNVVSAVLLLLVVDIALPMTLFYILEKYMEPLYALILASLPPLMKMIFFAIVKRRLEVTGFLVIFGFGASVMIATLTHNPRMLMLEKSFVTLIIGLFFLVTLIPLKFPICCGARKGERFEMRPLNYLFIKQMFPLGNIWVVETNQEKREEDKFQWLWREISSFRVGCYVSTAYWGCFMSLEFVAKLMLIFSPMSLDALVLWSNVLGLSALGVAFTINILVSRYGIIKMKKDVNNWALINDADIVKEGDQTCLEGLL